jgi:hypothetical protein
MRRGTAIVGFVAFIGLTDAAWAAFQSDPEWAVH